MKEEPFFSGISHSVDSQMAYSRHTLTCCLSKLRSSLEAGKRQLRVWLQYVCRMMELFLYTSFSVPLVLLWSPCRSAKDSRLYSSLDDNAYTYLCFGVIRIKQILFIIVPRF